MSAWKKALKSNQKPHRERRQPESRAHLGLLEKKKDYQERARDNEKKQKTLRILHKKTLNKNPDEFYHHMIKSKVRDDEHNEFDTPDEHTKEQMALMETQDLKYIAMKRTIEANKIKRLQGQLHMIDVANGIKNNHTFFVDDEDEAKNFQLAERLDTIPSLLDRRSNRPRMKDLEKMEITNVAEGEIKKLNEKCENAYKELKKRIEREKEMSVIQQTMEIKKALKQKRLLKPKRIQAATKDSALVYQFRYERKR